MCTNKRVSVTFSHLLPDAEGESIFDSINCYDRSIPLLVSSTLCLRSFNILSSSPSFISLSHIRTYTALPTGPLNQQTNICTPILTQKLPCDQLASMCMYFRNSPKLALLQFMMMMMMMNIDNYRLKRKMTQGKS